MVCVVVAEFNYNGFLGYTGLIMDKLGGFFVSTNYKILGGGGEKSCVAVT